LTDIRNGGPLRPNVPLSLNGKRLPKWNHEGGVV